ncbi:uncharacterized protein HMPREF1541_00858 [Cyphellophora europaea CBS 101466]|uniref:C4-dicarboxylate transporter/malic acid transporter n=1 Tax=Cyphellophora europaea (strain CBS 101466) TaxID=1220924 RepID=W2SD88_CYPE1|nr:uncharacterized protein HMPREF1541_00858 [Cyphellophora europaea CBS 101466]ETN46672.1 hypothetical protein HMPREF1541_00858 [Cyphellophora europaea CBS 101466]
MPPSRSSQRSNPFADPNPGGDGWRTPTIEDAHHPRNLELRRTHTSGLTEKSQQTDYFNGVHQRRADSRATASTHASAVDHVEPGEDGASIVPSEENMHLSIRQRLKHVTWAWFTLVMATGGVASTLHAVPFRFTGLWTIGVIFFVANIAFYVIIWAMIICRFWNYPYTFRASFLHPTESLFAPAVAVSFGTILINIVEYGFGEVGVWLNRAVLVLYWFDCGLAIVLSISIYLILWSTQHFTIARMTPIWIFPAYPLLIIGPHAANLSARLVDPREAIQVIVGGFTVQGIGFLVSLTVYAAFVYRLMTQKLPAESLRPGMFVSVGPSAFTASGIMGMASNLDQVFMRLPSGLYMDVESMLAASILKLIANWVSLWLWGLALWFFFVSLMANMVCFRKGAHMPFAMTWFSFIFPQTALTTATFRVAESFNVFAIKIVGCVMTVLLILVWLLVVFRMIKAIVDKQILWPEKGEDKSEGGFSMPKTPAERVLTNSTATKRETV